jgi:hypothetical protein
MFPSEGIEWAKLSAPHSSISFQGEATHEGYRNMPVAYVKCTEDLVILPDVQQRCIERMSKDAGIDVEVHELATGHCPNISAPKTIGQIVRKVAGEKI